MSIEEKLKDISEIKSMMENSTKFLSLSGLSGVVAGIIALIAAIIVYLKYQSTYIHRYGFEISDNLSDYMIEDKLSFISFIVVLALLTLFFAIGSGFYFTYRKSIEKGYKLIGHASRLLLINLMIPLLSGGLFVVILLFHQLYFLLVPATLIFYGLALVNASKYTLRDVRYLGLLEIVVGLIAGIFIGYGLLFWAFGFGILHIVYGISMYLKYDR
jgi:hypothetical protein